MHTATITPKAGNGHIPPVQPPQDTTVLTPGGYKPRSNVYLLEKGYHVASRDGQLWLVDSTKGEIQLLGDHEAAAAPPETNPAIAAGQTGPNPSALPGSSWVAYTEFENVTRPAISLFTAEWIVPNPPKDQGDQTIFIFIGLQNNQYILQPVLQWGPSFAGGGKFWSISNWYTDGNTKDTVCTPAQKVAPGDKLSASMQLVSQVDRSFTYKISFQKYPDLDHVQPNVMELFWAFVVLESYNIANDNQYPPVEQTQVKINNISAGETQLSPAWHPVITQRTGIHPHAEVNANMINLKYR